MVGSVRAPAADFGPAGPPSRWPHGGGGSVSGPIVPLRSSAKMPAARVRTATLPRSHVRRLGRQFVRHHTEALEQGASVTVKLGIPPPAGLDPQQAIADRLARRCGRAFDRLWLKPQFAAHVDAVALNLHGRTHRRHARHPNARDQRAAGRLRAPRRVDEQFPVRQAETGQSSRGARRNRRCA